MDYQKSCSYLFSSLFLCLATVQNSNFVLAFHEESYLNNDEEDALLLETNDQILQEQNLKARDNWEYVHQNCYDKEGNELNKTIDGGYDWRGDPVTFLCSGLVANVKADCEWHLGFWKICEQHGIKMAHSRGEFDRVNPNLKTNYDAFKALDEIGKILDIKP